MAMAMSLWALGVAAVGSPAQAGTIQFNPTGTNSSPVITIAGIDPGPGNALAVGSIPLAVGNRVKVRPGFWLKLAGVSGLAVTVLSMIFNLMPIVDVSSTWTFAAKVVATAVALNAVGIGIYCWGTRGRRPSAVA